MMMMQKFNNKAGRASEAGNNLLVHDNVPEEQKPTFTWRLKAKTFKAQKGCSGSPLTSYNAISLNSCKGKCGKYPFMMYFADQRCECFLYCDFARQADEFNGNHAMVFTQFSDWMMKARGAEKQDGCSGIPVDTKASVATIGECEKHCVHYNYLEYDADKACRCFMHCDFQKPVAAYASESNVYIQIAGSLQNPHEECLDHCSQQSGPCQWCGSGKCCKKGHNGGENGCGMNEGGEDSHVCVRSAPYVCAVEGGNCVCDGVVFYGSQYQTPDDPSSGETTAIHLRAMQNEVAFSKVSIPCTIDSFGGDPAPGVAKHCICEASASATGLLLPPPRQAGEPSFTQEAKAWRCGNADGLRVTKANIGVQECFEACERERGCGLCDKFAYHPDRYKCEFSTAAQSACDHVPATGWELFKSRGGLCPGFAFAGNGYCREEDCESCGNSRFGQPRIFDKYTMCVDSQEICAKKCSGRCRGYAFVNTPQYYDGKDLDGCMAAGKGRCAIYYGDMNQHIRGTTTVIGQDYKCYKKASPLWGAKIKTEKCIDADTTDLDNICDGTEADCVEKGKEQCLLMSNCYAIMYNEAHLQSNKGVKACSSLALEREIGWITIDKLDMEACGDWGKWGPCSAPCNGGTRTRRIANPKPSRDLACPDAITEPCNTQACGCSGSPSQPNVQLPTECYGIGAPRTIKGITYAQPWSKCEARCDAGYYGKVEAKCSPDGDWSYKGVCKQACGPLVNVPNAKFPTDCKPEAFAKCSGHCLPYHASLGDRPRQVCMLNGSWVAQGQCVPNQNCEYTWSQWGACSATCGQGTQTRQPIVTTPWSGYGKPCPGYQTRWCNDQPCGCCSSVDVAGAESYQPKSMGQFTAVEGLTRHGRMVYKNADDLYLFYRKRVSKGRLLYQGWHIGEDYTKTLSAALVASRSDPAWCPTHTTVLWYASKKEGVYNARFTKVPALTVKCTMVSCGGHGAFSCAECTQGNGASWCNGDCQWTDNQCVAKAGVAEGPALDCAGDWSSWTECPPCGEGNRRTRKFIMTQFPSAGGTACPQTPEYEACPDKICVPVSCGGHTADFCSKCPQGHGAPWCNGDCEWKDNACVDKADAGQTTTVSCGTHNSPTCAGCPQGNGKDWCNGDCEWINDLCVAKADSVCNDGVRNGDETGIDCGGSCTTCGMKLKCESCGECGWNGADQQGQAGLNGGAHPLSTCLASCEDRADCKFAAFSSSGYCHTFSTCTQQDAPLIWALYEKTVSAYTCVEGYSSDWTAEWSNKGSTAAGSVVHAATASSKDECHTLCDGYGAPAFNFQLGAATAGCRCYSGDQRAAITVTGTGWSLCMSGGCSDGVKNGDETGVDCGGSCASCSHIPEDCKSEIEWAVTQGKHRASAPTWYAGMATVTGVDHTVATFGDFQRFFKCTGDKSDKCNDQGLQFPAVCSAPPCTNCNAGSKKAPPVGANCNCALPRLKTYTAGYETPAACQTQCAATPNCKSFALWTGKQKGMCALFDAPCTTPCPHPTYAAEGYTNDVWNMLPDQDCKGTWSVCTGACETASERTFTMTQPKQGNGVACPAATDCSPGDGTCLDGNCNCGLPRLSQYATGYETPAKCRLKCASTPGCKSFGIWSKGQPGMCALFDTVCTTTCPHPITNPAYANDVWNL